MSKELLQPLNDEQIMELETLKRRAFDDLTGHEQLQLSEELSELIGQNPIVWLLQQLTFHQNLLTSKNYWAEAWTPVLLFAQDNQAVIGCRPGDKISAKVLEFLQAEKQRQNNDNGND